MPYRNGRQGMVSGLLSINAKLYISLHPYPGFSDPILLRLVTRFCQRRSQQSSSGCDGTCSSPSRSTSARWKLSARRPLCDLNGRTHKVVGVESGGCKGTLLMLYQVIVRSRLDYGCLGYGTASNTNQLDNIHNTGLRLVLRAICTRPISSMYPETTDECRSKLSWQLLPTPTMRNIMPCMNFAQGTEIYFSPGKMEEEAWPDPQHVP